MSDGFCLLAQNNSTVDYVKQAYALAVSIHKFNKGQNISLITNDKVPEKYEHVFDKIINIPWTDLSEAKGADPISIAEIMTEQFGAKEQNGLFYFDDAKTLVMYCNGMWCGQSPNNIKSLLKYGYPADKIKWFRGGMQTWEILGFNTVK